MNRASMITQSLNSFSSGRLAAARSSLLRSFCASTSVQPEIPIAAAEEEDAPSHGTSADKEDTRTMWNLYKRLSAIGSTKAKVSNVLDEFVKEGRVVRKIHLLDCIRKLRTYKRHQHCLEILEWMDKTKYNNLYKSDYALRLDLICKTKGVAEAEKFFESLSAENKSLYTYGALLNCYCDQKLSDKAAELLSEMEKLNYVSSLTFNNLMTLALKTGKPEKVPEIVEEMKSRNFEMNSYSYSLLIQSYQLLDDMESVERALQEIEKDEKRSHWSIYSNLAAAYIRDGNFEKAEMALKKLEQSMKKNSRVPNPVPYHYLISFYAGIGNLAEVNRIWESLKSDFKITTNISYMTMLQALLKLDQQDELVRNFEEWEAGVKHYDTRIVTIVMAGYLRQNKIKEAEKVFNGAVEKSGSRFFKGREIMIAYFLDKRDINRALEYLEAAADEVKTGDKWQPSVERIREFCNYFEEEKDVDGAEKFLKLLRTLRCFKSKSYSWLLRTYAGAEKTEPEMRRRMKEDGFEITSEYEVLLEKVCPQ